MMRHLQCVLTLLTLGLPLAVQAADARQYKLEAAFLYNFFNYITWPGYNSPDALKDATVCIQSGDPILPYMGYVQEKMSDQRSLKVRDWRAGDSLNGCHLVFSRSGAAANSPSTLTVSIRNGFIDQGGMIGMEQQEGHIGLRINNSRLNERGFQVSSRLLSLAQEVK